MALHLAAVAVERDWDLMSVAAHPGYTRTNLQTAGAALGSSAPPPSSGLLAGPVTPRPRPGCGPRPSSSTGEHLPAGAIRP